MRSRVLILRLCVRRAPPSPKVAIIRFQREYNKDSSDASAVSLPYSLRAARAVARRSDLYYGYWHPSRLSLVSTCLQSPHCLVLGSGSVRREKIAAKKPTLVDSDREKTFGPTITGLIHRHIGPLAERLRLWDSKLRVRGGRPDTMKILKEVYHACQWGRAPKGCKEAAGIPAWHSLKPVDRLWVFRNGNTHSSKIRAHFCCTRK
ncbi:hypothetical protein V8E53_001068 [Lactarius tabidus]